jgi:hypothetical protein
MMDATSFELNVSLPPDGRFVLTLRELAVHAARYAGCRGHDANAFGAVVERVARECVAFQSASIEVVVRRGDGPVEVLIDCERQPTEMIVTEPHVSVEWTRDRGRPVCRVARAMPIDV